MPQLQHCLTLKNRSSIIYTFNEEETITSREQLSTERNIRKAYEERTKLYQENSMRLCKEAHIDYLKQRFVDLPESAESLDASQPWLLYWSLHSMRLLKCHIEVELIDGSIQLLKSCQSIHGGFAGGPKQLAHLATTYAAINALCELSTVKALELINRKNLFNWLLSLRNENNDGSFRLHENGETDVRGCYCAIAVAYLCQIVNENLIKNTAQWIANCQTYEGGFGGAPGLEAHGGCTFCAVASLALLNCLHLIDIPRLLRWTSRRQMSLEGGFQGRTNKLVDSCYSFWIGGLFSIIQQNLRETGTKSSSSSSSSSSSTLLDNWLFDSQALQEYVLICCQRYPVDGPIPKAHHYMQSSFSGGANSGGGLIDKPGKSPDPYHTCYALSGLTLARHPLLQQIKSNETNNEDDKPTLGNIKRERVKEKVEEEEDELAKIHVLVNITQSAYEFAQNYFSSH